MSDAADRNVMSNFPAFYSLPKVTADSASPDAEGEWWMVAQIKENMTLSQPTLIVTDRTGMDFAVVFEDRNFDLKERGLKKGCTIVVPQARRTEKGEGKKAILKIEKEDSAGVKAIPGNLEAFMATGAFLADGSTVEKCSACRNAEGVSKRCSGCGIAAYCCKGCQVKAWNEGHKIRCKVAKAMREIWPSIHQSALE